MSGVIPPLSQYAFPAWCSVKKKSTGTTIESISKERDDCSIGYHIFYVLAAQNAMSLTAWRMFKRFMI
jgi:hypothetical protein